MTTKMETKKQNPDDYMSPKCIFEEIIEYIPKDKVISMPFFGDGTAGKHMTDLGFNVIHQDEDFFETDRGEMVLDNPPFSLRQRIIEELIFRDKPFMLILPISTITNVYFKDFNIDVQLIIPAKRTKFISYDKETKTIDENWKKKSFSQNAVWICWKMNFDKDIIQLR
jgi:hypothetical protein